MTAFQKLGRYLILQEIAKGGMAVIYRAKLLGVEGFEKEVAVKKILPFWSQNEEFISMLIDEAKILVHLHHPNIVQVIELGKEDDSYFIVMEFVNGFDLRSLMRNLQKQDQKLPLELLVYITKQICLGLDFAHNKTHFGENLHLVHRDISPQNILVGKEGEVKITDFGIAKTTQKSTQTQTGVLKGKFSYMSPEQALGEKIDHQTDIFALGVLFYELLFEHKCFDGNNDFEIIEKVKRAEITYPEDLADELRVILERSLAVNKKERYQDVIEFYQDLENLEATFSKKAYSRDLQKFLQNHFAEHFVQQAPTHSNHNDRTVLNAADSVNQVNVTAATKIDEKTQIDVAQKTQLYSENPSQGKTQILVGSSEDYIKTQIQTRVLPPSKRPQKPFYKQPSLLFALIGIFSLVMSFVFFYNPNPKTLEQPNNLVDIQNNLEKVLVQPETTATIEKAQEPETIEDKPVEPKIKIAKLNLTTQPATAKIIYTIDNEPQESTAGLNKNFEFEKELTIPITVSADNFHSQELLVTFNENTLEFNKEIQLAPIEYGKVYLYSRPWATFRIKEFSENSFSSGQTVDLPIGSYTLSVYSPSQKRSTAKQITVKKEQTLSCLASFTPGGRVSCRYK